VEFQTAQGILVKLFQVFNPLDRSKGGENWTDVPFRHIELGHCRQAHSIVDKQFGGEFVHVNVSGNLDELWLPIPDKKPCPRHDGCKKDNHKQSAI
jgi:hypothetical protein